jgi:competence protein ComGC
MFRLSAIDGGANIAPRLFHLLVSNGRHLLFLAPNKSMVKGLMNWRGEASEVKMNKSLVEIFSFENNPNRTSGNPF